MNTPFEITKEEVLNLAAQKLADSAADEGTLWDKAESLVEKRVGELVSRGLVEKVNEVLTKEMEALMAKEIVPIDIWGEKCGTPTTIRAELHKRAMNFWNTCVNDEGKEYTYGKPRHQRFMESIVKDEFAKAVKDNCDGIVKAFKASLKTSTASIVSEHIDRLIR